MPRCLFFKEVLLRERGRVWLLQCLDVWITLCKAPVLSCKNKIANTLMWGGAEFHVENYFANLHFRSWEKPCWKTLTKRVPPCSDGIIPNGMGSLGLWRWSLGYFCGWTGMHELKWKRVVLNLTSEPLLFNHLSVWWFQGQDAALLTDNYRGGSELAIVIASWRISW